MMWTQHQFVHKNGCRVFVKNFVRISANCILDATRGRPITPSSKRSRVKWQSTSICFLHYISDSKQRIALDQPAKRGVGSRQKILNSFNNLLNHTIYYMRISVFNLCRRFRDNSCFLHFMKKENLEGICTTQ